MQEISVVIPVYNAQECLEELYQRLTIEINKMTAHYEIILVEDGGKDNSWVNIKKLAAKDKRVKGIRFSRNFGQHYGITAGIDIAQGKWIIVMDCDLQDRPEEIPSLYYKALEGYDIVLAKRRMRQDHWMKRTCSRLFYFIFSYFLGIKYDADVGNFRIISRKVAEALKEMREQLRFFGGLVTWMGFPTAYISVDHAERFAGQTSYNYKKLFRLAINTILAYSDKPLRIVVRTGFLISFAAFIYGMYILWKGIFKQVPVMGWSSLIASIYFIGGIIIANLGIIGIYLGKTFDETKKRPLYIVCETTDDDQQ